MYMYIIYISLDAGIKLYLKIYWEEVLPMTNEEFQKGFFEELASIKEEFASTKKEFREEFASIKEEFNHVKTQQGDMMIDIQHVKSRQDDMVMRQDDMADDIQHVITRQDEMYAVMCAIEHNNQIGRSELDGQNIRLAKAEGKFKKAAKVFEEDVDVLKSSGF